MINKTHNLTQRQLLRDCALKYSVNNAYYYSISKLILTIKMKYKNMNDINIFKCIFFFYWLVGRRGCFFFNETEDLTSYYEFKVTLRDRQLLDFFKLLYCLLYISIRKLELSLKKEMLSLNSYTLKVSDLNIFSFLPDLFFEWRPYLTMQFCFSNHLKSIDLNKNILQNFNLLNT